MTTADFQFEMTIAPRVQATDSDGIKPGKFNQGLLEAGKVAFYETTDSKEVGRIRTAYNVLSRNTGRKFKSVMGAKPNPQGGFIHGLRVTRIA